MESVLVLHWPNENSMWLLLNNSHVTIKEEVLMDIAELQDTWLIKIFLNLFEKFFQYGKSDYAQLMPAAFKHWKEIETKSGKKLFTPAGIMNIRNGYVARVT